MTDTVNIAAVEAYVDPLRRKGQLLGYDRYQGILVLFVPENEPLDGFPRQVAGLDVQIRPLPRPQEQVDR